MMQFKYDWIPGLSESIPKDVNSDRITSYTVALEGWRRGLSLKYCTTKSRGQIFIQFILSNGSKTLKFSRSTGPDVTREAVNICKNKLLTKKYLEKADIPVPKGKAFITPINYDELLKYAEILGYPVVIKPISAKMGKGVIPEIKNEEELIKAFNYVTNELGYSEIIVEKHVFGEEYRVYVVKDKVIGAIKRIPAYVIGDGVSSIKDLIEIKNKERKQIPSLRSRPIKIDTEVKEYVSQAGYTLDSILDKNEYLVLRKNSNVSSGGEPIDVTDELSENIKRIAVNACRAIPGLPISGVDIVVDKINNTCSVLELNTGPGISSHLFPLKGKARDIPKAIIDYYFPETSSQKNPISNRFYFDYSKIENKLLSHSLKEIKLPMVPQGEIIFKAFIVSGKVQGVNYRQWIRRQAFNLDLNGFAENKKDGSVFIVVSGNKKNIEEFEKIIYNKGPKHAKIENISVVNWDNPINIGFVIKKEI